MAKVTIVMGAPGGGKSTLTKKLTEQGFVSLNRDTEGGSIPDLLPKMEKLLSDNKNVVLDNVFAKAEVRKPFIDMALKFSADVNCMLMDTSIEDAAFNVVQRAIDLTGNFPSPDNIKKAKHTNIFPPVVLFKYKKEFEKPDVSEGFSNIEVVKFVRKDDPTFVNKAAIFDYDSTIRECIGGNGKYPLEKEQIAILPKRKEIIQSYKDKGYILLGVSNQSGVSKKELSYDKATELFEHTNKLLGIDIDFAFCPHQSNPISCYCRKPLQGLFVHFMKKYKLNRKECFFVGDFTTDATFAKRSGIKYIDQAEFFK